MLFISLASVTSKVIFLEISLFEKICPLKMIFVVINTLHSVIVVQFCEGRGCTARHNSYHIATRSQQNACLHVKFISCFDFFVPRQEYNYC